MIVFIYDILHIVSISHLLTTLVKKSSSPIAYNSGRFIFPFVFQADVSGESQKGSVTGSRTRTFAVSRMHTHSTTPTHKHVYARTWGYGYFRRCPPLHDSCPTFAQNTVPQNRFIIFIIPIRFSHKKAQSLALIYINFPSIRIKHVQK